MDNETRTERKQNPKIFGILTWGGESPSKLALGFTTGVLEYATKKTRIVGKGTSKNRLKEGWWGGTSRKDGHLPIKKPVVLRAKAKGVNYEEFLNG